ncbi:MAG: hotdog fold thioesterase, partial [Bacteroidia bacterium]
MHENDFQLLKHAIENMMPANKILGLNIVEVTVGSVHIHVPFKEEFIGDFLQGRWHGGILAAIADTAGGIAGATTLHSDKDRLNTVDMRIDYLHAAIKTDIYAKA